MASCYPGCERQRATSERWLSPLVRLRRTPIASNRGHPPLERGDPGVSDGGGDEPEEACGGGWGVVAGSAANSAPHGRPDKRPRAPQGRFSGQSGRTIPHGLTAGEKPGFSTAPQSPFFERICSRMLIRIAISSMATPFLSRHSTGHSYFAYIGHYHVASISPPAWACVGRSYL